MIEIRTPNDWYSAFRGTPMLAIDESTGKIYHGGDAYKLSKEAIGQIDYAQNCIYGTDYAKLSRQPVAKLIHDGNTIKVYNWKDIGYDNKPMFVDQPLLYIVNGKIYDHDPRYNVVDNPRGHFGGGNPPPKPVVSSGGGNSSFLGGGWGLILLFAGLTLLWRMFDSFRRNPLMFVGIYIGLILFGFILAKIILGIFSLIKGEGFLQGFNTKILKGLKKGYRGPTIKKKAPTVSSSYTPPQSNTPPTPPANPKPSKPTTNPAQPKTPSITKTPHTYSHTCLKCGKTFYNTTANPEVKLCSYCAAKIAVESEKKELMNSNPKPGKYFHTCQRCAKDFWSDNASAEMCDSCKAVIKEGRNLGKKKDPKHSTYSITCLRCGDTFQSPYKKTANRYCTSCTAIIDGEKKKAEEDAKKRKIEEEKKKNIKPPVKEKLEFGIFTCPKCGASNRGPKGKILTCGNPNCKNKFKAEG